MREHTDIEITGEGRDAGKTFRITEMSAYDAEWWAVRVLALVAEADREGKLMGLVANGGLESMASVGAAVLVEMLPRIDPDKVKPLWDKLAECWSIVINKESGQAMRLQGNEIEEVSTLFLLRMRTLAFHLDFFTRSTRNLQT